MNTTVLGSISKQKKQQESTRPPEVKDNGLISLFCKAEASQEFIGYMQVPENFVEMMISQLAKGNIDAIVADSEATTERALPTF